MDAQQDYSAAQEEAQLELQFQREYEEQERLTSQAARNLSVDNNRLGRLPIFQRRNHGSGELDLPHEPNSAQEVFGGDFYDLFPWAKGVDPFDENATRWEPAERYVENRADFKGLKPDDNAEVPPAIAFVNGLISLELDDLDEDSQACPICLEKYREGERGEMPLQLPCAPNHVIGKECLLLWLTDVGDVVHHASCPICRTECVKEKRKHIGTDEGLRQRLRDVNYLLTGPNPLTLTQEGRDRWETVKSYVNTHLANAADAKRQRKQRFIMILQIELRTNPNFTTNIISEDDIELSQRVYSEALEDLERTGMIAEFLEAADDAHGNELEGEIAVRMAAATPPRLLRLMEEVYEYYFEELGMESAELFDDNDVEEGENESDTDSDDDAMEMGGMVRSSIWCESCQYWHLRPHQSIIDPAPFVPLNPGLTIEYLENSRTDGPTSAPVQVSAAGPECHILWCTSCGRIHPEGTEHQAGHHEDNVV
ncbi:hypothetical protein N7G274_006824 [Stereocaulon virgatum]|uniref:RING-type domain-containing protein n=1 Tax=Stereocaulon virgatum TaxID=373712 RepID=A0ABR4A625_9LECA